MPITVLLTVCLLYFVIHFIGTVAYAPRITGVLSGRLSLSISIANILSVIARFASALMVPILSKQIESSLIINPKPADIPNDYIPFFGMAIIGTWVGTLCFKQSIKFIYYTVVAYDVQSNILLQMLKVLLTLRAKENIQLHIATVNFKKIDYQYILLNVLVTCIYTSATLAAIYSAYIVPQYRVTSLSCAFLINGVGTVIFATILDPYVTSITDATIAGTETFPHFYYRIKVFIYSRLVGVVLSIGTFHLFIYLITKSITYLQSTV